MKYLNHIYDIAGYKEQDKNVIKIVHNKTKGTIYNYLYISHDRLQKRKLQSILLKQKINFSIKNCPEPQPTFPWHTNMFFCHF